MKRELFDKIAQEGVQQAKVDESTWQDERPDYHREQLEGTKRIGEARWIPIDKIRPDLNQPRRAYDEQKLAELTDSIAMQGIIEPITVQFMPEENYFQIITGERRWRAAQSFGLKELPCLVNNDLEQPDRLARQLIENLQREDLWPIDKARALLEYKESLGDGATWADVEAELGLSKPRRKQFLHLLKLPEDIQAEIVALGKHQAGQVTEKHARALLKLNKEPERQQQLLELIKEGDMTGEEALNWVASGKAKPQVFRCEYVSKAELLDRLRKEVARLELELELEI